MAENKGQDIEVNFVSLVLMLSSSAWVSLGKVTDPGTGEIKKDLPAAKYTIDTLIMLREKTKGNLSGDEERLLNGLIADLQGNYAEAVFSGEEAKVEHESARSEDASGEGGVSGKDAAQDKGGQGSEQTKK